MGVIPSEFYQEVAPQGELRPNTIDRATPENFGSQVGQALQQGGDMLAQHAVQRQQILNETNVNDVFNKDFFPAFQDKYRNFYALQGKDAETQYPQYAAEMQGIREQIRAGLPNAMQQKMFDQLSQHSINLELQSMSRHAAQETLKWQNQTSDAMLQTYVNIGADKFSDPQTLDLMAHSIDAEVRAHGKGVPDLYGQNFYGAGAGQSDQFMDARVRDWKDKLFSEAVKRQAGTGDPMDAQALLQRAAAQGNLSGTAQGELDKYLQPYIQTAQAQRAYGAATGGPVASQIISEARRQGVDPTIALTTWSCEGSVTNPATKNPNSQATGHFQFMPGTWTDMGGTDQDRLDPARQIELGVKLIKQNSDKLAQDLGRRPQPWEVYLAHQQGVKGAEALMSADPNANAGQVVGNPKAITLNGGTADMTAGRFLTMIRGYVDRHSQMYDGQGLPTAQNIRENYQAQEQAVREQARRDYPGNPEMGDRYVSYYEQHGGQVLRADHMTDQANMDIINAGTTGPTGVKSWAEFQADPKRAQAYAAISAKDPSIWDTVDKAITTNALHTWDPKPTRETSAVYNELKGMQLTDRSRFANMDLNRYYGAVPITQFNDLQNDQPAIRKSDTATTEKLVLLDHAAKVLEPTFNEAKAVPGSQYYGADPHSAFADSAKKYNQYIGSLSQAIVIWRANNNGKIPSDADMLKIGRDMLMPGQPGPATVGGAPVGPSTGSKSSANASQGEESPTAKYEAYLKQNDYPVTPANIKALQDQDAKKKAAQ